MSVVVEKELPKGWVGAQMKDLAFYINGRAFKPSEWEDKGKPIIRIQNLTGSGKKLNRFSGKVEKKYEIFNGDLLISWSATLGAFIYHGEPAILNQHIFKVKPLVEKKFIFYLTNFILNELKKKTHGSGMQHITKSPFESHDIFLPPLNEQKRIVAKIEELFSLVDSAKDTLEKTLVLLKQYRQSILKHAFEGKLTEEWRNTHECNPIKLDNISQNCKSNNRKFHSIEPEVFSNLPKLPPSWSWTYLSNIGKLERGKSKHRPRNDPILFGGNYPFIQTGVIRNSKQKILSFEQTYNEKGLSQSRLFPSGTLCITIAANIAETGILTFDSCFPDSIVGFTPDNNIVISEFVMYYIESNKSKINSIAPSTAQKNINLEILQNIFIPIMNFNEIEVIVEKIEESFSLIEKNEILIDKLLFQYSQIKNSILKQAFGGKLVPQDPNDEPAEVLLQRIREEKNGK